MMSFSSCLWLPNFLWSIFFMCWLGCYTSDLSAAQGDDHERKSSPDPAVLRLYPQSGTYCSPIIACAVVKLPRGQRLVYSDDGQVPNASSWSLPSCGVLVTDSTTLNVSVIDEAGVVRQSQSTSYVISWPFTAARPVTTPGSGNYITPLTANLTTSTPGAQIRYSVDGSEPTFNSSVYRTALDIAKPTLVRARAFGGWIVLKYGSFQLKLPMIAPSGIMLASYNFHCAPPLFGSPAGVYSAPITVGITSATPGATLRYRLDGADPTEADPIVPATGVSVGVTSDISSRAFRAGWTPSEVVRGRFTLQVPVPGITPSSGSEVYVGPLTVTLTSSEGSNIFYTLDGTQPSAQATPYVGPIILTQDTTVTAIAIRDGWLASHATSLFYHVLVKPVIVWAVPAAITYGMPLTSSQLSASASAPGTYIYNPAIGTVLPAGNSAISLRFVPDDNAHFTVVTATVDIIVNQAIPKITWAIPASIVSGSALTGTQLSAAAPTAGTFTYTPAAGAVLPIGTNVLTVSFVPDDNLNYAKATVSVSIVVTPAIADVLERKSVVMMRTDAFDATSWETNKAYRLTYMSIVDPARIWQSHLPGTGVPSLSLVSSQTKATPQSTCSWSVRVAPYAPVNAVITDRGRFSASNSRACTVQADESGLATLDIICETEGTLTFLASSPKCAGRITGSVEIAP